MITQQADHLRGGYEMLLGRGMLVDTPAAGTALVPSFTLSAPSQPHPHIEHKVSPCRIEEMKRPNSSE
jgi:hypothetical protein